MSRSQPGSHTAQRQITEEIRRIRFDSRPSRTRDIVPQGMERDTFFDQRGAMTTSDGQMLVEQVFQSVVTERLALCGGKHRIGGLPLAFS